MKKSLWIRIWVLGLNAIIGTPSTLSLVLFSGSELMIRGIGDIQCFGVSFLVSVESGSESDQSEIGQEEGRVRYGQGVESREMHDL